MGKKGVRLWMEKGDGADDVGREGVGDGGHLLRPSPVLLLSNPSKRRSMHPKAFGRLGARYADHRTSQARY